MLSKEMLNGSWSEIRFYFIRCWNHWIDSVGGWNMLDMRDNVETCYTCEIAKLDDGSIIYGSVQEIEQWVQANDPRWVTRYLDHMSPAHVQKFGKYVGKSLTDPYSVGGTHSRRMDYDLGRIVVTEKI